MSDERNVDTLSELLQAHFGVAGLTLHVTPAAAEQLYAHTAFAPRLMATPGIGASLPPDLIGYIYGVPVHMNRELADGLAELRGNNLLHTFTMPSEGDHK